MKPSAVPTAQPSTEQSHAGQPSAAQPCAKRPRDGQPDVTQPATELPPAERPAAELPHTLRPSRASRWFCRIAFAVVFALNVQCALSFCFEPDHFMAAYELSGTPGRAAVQGIGIAFLMWNATYPPVIVAPQRFRSLAVVVIVQQAIGLVGESLLRASLPAQNAVLVQSITRFIWFDAAGLALMAASFAVLAASSAHAAPARPR